jgi:hypothetical protein
MMDIILILVIVMMILHDLFSLLLVSCSSRSLRSAHQVKKVAVDIWTKDLF